ncbi:MAG: hypothetical protein MZV64_60885 [Ignavibacteriales bacterium]|nr:hypothetical protein [Ignavibacteriales bacterium]
MATAGFIFRTSIHKQCEKLELADLLIPGYENEMNKAARENISNRKTT